MPAEVTAEEVMRELRRHMRDCRTLNQTTATAITSMSESHRALAGEMKEIRKETVERWDKFNANAWKALGAIGLTVLAGIVGVVVQNYSLANSAATKAAQVASAPPAWQARRDAQQQQILNQLAAIRKNTGP